jgi:hypothetical protein
MQLTWSLWRRYGFLLALWIIPAGFIVTGASVSAAQPAQLVTLSGDVAALLRTLYKPIVPVLVAGAGDNVVAIVFHEDPDEVARLREDLFSTEAVEGCAGDGPIACCDMEIGEMVLSATDGGQSGWVRMGEKCEIPGLEEVEFRAVPAEATSELNRSFGINTCFMELAGAGGKPLVLVNAPSQDSPLWEYCLRIVAGAEGILPGHAQAPAQGAAIWLTSSTTWRAMLPATSPVILAATLDSCQSQKPANCKDKGYAVCAKVDDHWYKKNDQGKWCKLSTTCDPC